MHHRINLNRCARGACNSFTPAAFGAVGLFNDSAAAHLLLVWRAYTIGDASANLYFTSVTKTRLTTQNNGLVVPLITDEPQPPGRIDTQSLLAAPTADGGIINTAVFPTPASDVIPIAIIKPGWSFVLSADAGGAGTFHAGFFWEWCYAEELFNPTIGNRTIDP